MLLAFTTIASASDETLSFPFTLDSVKNWKYISDQVMGGVSEGTVSLEQDGDMVFARLTGDVSTKNNGGFIKINWDEFINILILYKNVLSVNNWFK